MPPCGLPRARHTVPRTRHPSRLPQRASQTGSVHLPTARARGDAILRTTEEEERAVRVRRTEDAAARREFNKLEFTSDAP